MYPLVFDIKKTAPSQIAADVLAVLRENRLVPFYSVYDASANSSVSHASVNSAVSHASVSSASGEPAEPARVSGPENEASHANPLVWADRIVSVGRGSIGPDGSADKVVRLARTLAGCLNASFGSSKAAVDLGIMPAACQVGKTSSIVNPDLYVACGISGSIQHQDGMRQSRFIVAINTDPSAHIFRIADICICGDTAEMLEAMIKELTGLTRAGFEAPQSSPHPSDGT